MVQVTRIQLAATVLLVAGQLLLTAPAAYAEGTADGGELKATVEDDVNIPQQKPAAELPEGDLTVEDVTVEGNRLIQQEDILNVIKTHRGDRFDRDQVMKDLKAVNGMGYFDDRSLQAIPEMGGNGVLLKIRVQENAPVTQFAFQGNTVCSSEELSKLFSDQLGKPQNLTQLSQSIDKIEQAYHEKGFMLARVTDVHDDPDGSVSIKIDEGQISDIKIVGNKKTKDFIIRNALKLKPGQVYNERQLTADLRKIYGNGYFNDIRRSLTPDPANPDKYQLKVEVDEKRTGSIGLGGGVDTIQGPFGSFGFSDSNFRGRGQILSFNSQMGTGMMNGMTNAMSNGGANYLPTGISAQTYQFNAGITEPNFRGTGTSVSLNGFANNYASMMVDDSMQRSVGASITASKQLGNHVTGSLGLTGEQTFLRGFDNILGSGTSALNTIENHGLAMGMSQGQAQQYAQGIRNQQLKGGLYASFSPTIAYDTRNDYFNPTKGTFAKLTGGPSIGITGNSFGKVGVSVSHYKQITKETTLATNIQGGAAIGGVPQFGMYRLGSMAGGIRGYRQFTDLGTGTSLLMSSVELRHRLPLPRPEKGSGASGAILNYFDKNVRAVAFSDFGALGGNNAVNGAYGRAMIAGSVGVGLRLNIPMLGLVQVGYGMPLLSTALGRMTPRFTLGFGDKF